MYVFHLLFLPNILKIGLQQMRKHLLKEQRPRPNKYVTSKIRAEFKIRNLTKQFIDFAVWYGAAHGSDISLSIRTMNKPSRVSAYRKFKALRKAIEMAHSSETVIWQPNKYRSLWFLSILVSAYFTVCVILTLTIHSYMCSLIPKCHQYQFSSDSSYIRVRHADTFLILYKIW